MVFDLIYRWCLKKNTREKLCNNFRFSFKVFFDLIIAKISSTNCSILLFLLFKSILHSIKKKNSKKQKKSPKTLIFSDFYTTTDNQLYFIQYAAVLSSNWKLTRAKSTNEHFKNKMDAIVASLNEDANPVLFKCHFKNK